ncbi:unnamed protein product [Brassica rapa subsp. narinosa]
MHEVGFPLDLSVLTRLIPSLFFLAVGVFYFLRNTAAKYFDIGAAAAGGFDRELVAEDCTTKCSRCNSVRYCSEECQTSDWSSGHQRRCREIGITTLTPSARNSLRFRASRFGDCPERDQNKINFKPREVLFPYEEFVRYFNWDNTDLAPCGLMNCGNSCFANVILQCLSWTRPLVAYLLERGHRSECMRDDWCFFCAFQTHVERASQSRYPFSPVNIISRLTNIGGTLGYGRQEDAHEFMRYAIDTMQSVCLDEFGGEKMVPPRCQETTLVQYIFGGVLQSQVQCTVCNNVSEQYENMMDLTVEIHGDAVSLEECLDQFTAREWLQGDNMYKCDRCSDYVKACKRLTIRRPPNVLTIALKRFKGGRYGKLNKRISFPETLDLRPYMSQGGEGSDVYTLYAVIVHLDMLNASFFGHYICYIKDFSGNWYRIDDSEIESVELEDVLSQRAYMLLYSRIQARSPLPCATLGSQVQEEKETDTLATKPCQKELVESSMTIPDSFISNHVKGKTQSTKLKLTSDVSDRSWEVELDGQRFARGWKQFSVHHGVRNDDVLSFRHDGDMVFHVTPFGRSFSHQIQFISSTSEDENKDDEHNIFDDDVYDEEEEHADAGNDDDDDGDSTSEEELFPSSKKKAITETETSLEDSYLVTHVTSSNLGRNQMGISNKFARPNGLKDRQCEIDLLNEEGKSWTLELRHNKTTGQSYMCRGWTSFCQGNGIKAGSACRFKLVKNGTKPVLQLCPNTSTILHKKRDVPETEGDEIEYEDCLETPQMNQNRTVAIEFKPHMLRTGQLRLPTLFARDNGINEAGEITIVNKDGVEWKLHLVSVKGRGQFYIRGFKDCSRANGIKKVGDSFTLDVVRGGTSPILKICSKVNTKSEATFDGKQTTNRRPSRMIQAPRAEEEMETRVQKKARVSAEGGSSRRTRASNKLSVGPANLQHKKPLEPCSISDQVSKVRQSIVHTLTDVRQFRSELEIKEQNLETSLLEIDALGMI